jgi:feruloyl-CoA ortho-hydroxylase
LWEKKLGLRFKERKREHLFYIAWNFICRAEALEYMKRSETLIKQLLTMLMKRLNVREIDETNESLLMGSKRINLNYYPVCPDQDLTVAIGRHSDVSTLTVLLQDQTGGLYVRPDNRHGWIHMEPVSGALVINIGDAMQIMSNGRYRSIEHRVAANGSKTRISVPIFVNPGPSDVIGPFPEVLAGGEKALYKNVLCSDYANHFYKRAHDGKTTIEYAKI